MTVINAEHDHSSINYHLDSDIALQLIWNEGPLHCIESSYYLTSCYYHSIIIHLTTVIYINRTNNHVNHYGVL